MNRQETKELLEQLATGELNAEQNAAFQKLLQQADQKAYLSILKLWEEVLTRHPGVEIPDGSLIQRIERSLDQEAPVIRLYQKEEQRAKPSRKTYLAIAASLLLMVAAGLFFYPPQQQKPETRNASIGLNDVAPGGNKAILTLADGKVIDLDSAKTGTIISQSGLRITKTKDGQLIYNSAPVSEEDPTRYNTISTPRGGQYQINLPDGSAVWLNAASTLKFPVLFTGKERQVELNGEAYFEIAKNKDKPFMVLCKQQSVEVLGTHFNINSYDDEEGTRTTLLEGSVKVTSTSNQRQVILKPGQQAQLDGNTFLLKEVDAEESMAWKNGFFVFNAESIPAAMRKIARWYDMEVVYEGNIGDQDLAGSVSRFQNVSEVLKTLKLTGIVHFKVEGRRITVIAN
ncbi:anti-sigma factor [Pedobacter sp. KBW06]|uniref:FecR family protein n=1 Tax=Pedobacter sp. KBW06 TaxID=2153359 RepID=UPI000F59E74E|nr:FecR domain-containing protein [Pedobacter sp. KBW06]RQO70330.1 anti-sigma factor [Pedobacter sp. KBW06]